MRRKLLVMRRSFLCGGVALFALATSAPAMAATDSLASSTSLPIGTNPNAASNGPPPANTLYGEGGSFAQPVINNLLVGDASGLSPEQGAYFVANIDQGRNDFVAGNADFAVTELPLTSAQQSAAQAAGRRFAYVPLFVQPIAIDALLECDPTQTLQPDTFCGNLQLTVPLLERLMTGVISSWTDPLLAQMMGGHPPTPSYPQVNPRYQVDPSAVTATLSSAFQADPTSQKEFASWIAGQQNVPKGPGPVETWGSGITGGDLAVVNALVPLNEQTNVPQNPPDWGIGDIAPLPLDWNGAPRSIPTVAIANAAGAYVLPTVTAARAALDDASVDPNTNLVTFQANASDKSAYPFCDVTYLVAPLAGLSPAKAAALSNFITYALSASVQGQLPNMGAAPVTAAMSQSGLAIAKLVANEPSSTGSTTSTVAGASGGVSFGATGSSTSSLAYTGTDSFPLFAFGAFLVVCGSRARRYLRGRNAVPIPSDTNFAQTKPDTKGAQ